MSLRSSDSVYSKKESEEGPLFFLLLHKMLLAFHVVRFADIVLADILGRRGSVGVKAEIGDKLKGRFFCVKIMI